MKKIDLAHKKPITFIIVGITLTCFLAIIIRSFPEVVNYRWKFNYILLSFSFAVLFIYFLLRVIAWRLIIESVGVRRIGLRRMFRIYFLPYLGKYIPGKVWPFLGRLYLFHEENVPEDRVIKAAIWEVILFLSTGTLIFLSSMFFWGDLIKVNYGFLAALTALSIYMCFNPHLYFRIVDFALKKFRIISHADNIDLPKRAVFKLLFIYSGLWGLCGLAFYLFISSIHTVPPNHVFFMIGIYPISWIAGTMVFIAPSGLGISDGVLAALLSLFLPVPVAVSIAILSRVWIAVGEMVCFLLASRPSLLKFGRANDAR